MSRMADPPILVGGGGSTLIWVHKKVSMTEIDPREVKRDAPKPDYPEDYRVFQLDVDITSSTVRINNSCGQTTHGRMDQTHSTRFDSEATSPSDQKSYAREGQSTSE